MPALARAGGVWIEMYHAFAADGRDPDDARASGAGPAASSAPTRPRFGADPDAPPPHDDGGARDPRRRSRLRRRPMHCQWQLAGIDPGRRAACSRTARAPTASATRRAPGGPSSTAPSGAPERPLGRLQCRPARRWAPPGPARGACGRTTEHRGRASGGHRTPPVARPLRPDARHATPAVVAAARARRPGARSPSGLMMAAYAALFSWLSVLRYRGFSTGRFDLGNMVQAVWSTSEGRLPRDHGHQRAPVLAPRGARRPRAGAVRAALVGVVEPRDAPGRPGGDRRDAARCRPSGSGGAGSATTGWRWRARRPTCSIPPCSTRRFRLPPGDPRRRRCCCSASGPPRRRAGWRSRRLRDPGGALPGAGRPPDRGPRAYGSGSGIPSGAGPRRSWPSAALAWVAIAVLVIMPAFALQSSNAHIDRYSKLGDGPREIALTFLTRPWEALAIVATPGRLAYLLGPAGAPAPAAAGRADARPGGAAAAD